MGMFWELFQESQIWGNQADTASVEQRIERLENVVKELIQILEKQTGEDINGDGRIG